MHGVYLSVNEFWRLYRRKARKKNKPKLPDMVFYHMLTLVCVAAANVVFRADSVSAAMAIWSGMLQVSDLAMLPQVLPATPGELLTEPLTFVLLAAGLIAFFPNTQQIMGRYSPILDWKKWQDVAVPAVQLQWRPTAFWAIYTGLTLFLAVSFLSRGQTEFIYFNF